MIIQQGLPVNFTCDSNITQPVDWYYRPRGSHTELRIVNGGRLAIHLKDKYAVESNDVYKLMIVQVSMEYGGTYRCVDNFGYGESASAELVVLGNVLF